MSKIALWIVGSIGIDAIETPAEKRADVLGGSVTYACAAASFFTPTGAVGVVGSDFPGAFLERYRRFGLDLSGLQTKPGATFRWSGNPDPELAPNWVWSTGDLAISTEPARARRPPRPP